MKSGSYLLSVMIGAVCLVLCLTLITVVSVNQRQQLRYQARQQELSRGVLGAEAQQISGQILQDLAKAAERNGKLREVLTRHGYQLQAPAASTEGVLSAAGAGTALYLRDVDCDHL